MLRRIFGPEKEKVIRRQRNLHNEEFHDCVKGDEEMGDTWNVARIEMKRNAYVILV